LRISIIGQGYVGLTISAFAGEHHEVVGFDLNLTIVERLNKGTSHIEGVDSLSIAKLIAKGKYKATTNPADIKRLRHHRDCRSNPLRFKP
jgi:UDP-N-acetyl-D-glucosamine dehydrogenase